MKKALLIGCLCSLTVYGDNRNAVEKEIFKVSPENILHLRETMAERKRFREVDLRAQPVAMSDSSDVRLLPGEQATPVYIYPLNPTSVSFVDMTGQPWKIKTSEAIDGNLIGAKVVENGIGNILQVHPKLRSGFAYIAVYLKELPKPVYLQLIVSESKFHSEKIIKVSQISPDTEITAKSIKSLSSKSIKNDDDLNSVLYNVTPFKAQRIKVDHAGVDAFKKGNDLLVRTRLNIFSPQEMGFETGDDGVSAYRLPFEFPIYATDSTKRVVMINIVE